MKKILMAMYLIGGLAMLFSCNDDSSSYPTPSDIDNLKATPGPGQITLSWTTPADENLYYVQVEYSIEATGKSYRKQVSQYASYNPQIEMFARFKMKSSFHKTKRII